MEQSEGGSGRKPARPGDGVTFVIRRKLGFIPYGDGAGRLPHRDTDMGGLEDATLSRLLCARSSVFWLRDTSVGDIYRIDPLVGAVRKVNFGDGDLWTLDVSRSGRGKNAVLVGYRLTGEKQARFRVIFLDDEGRPAAGAVELAPKLVAPTTVSVMPNGSIWVSEGRSTAVFDPSGKLVTSVEGSGIALESQVFLTVGKTPRCYDAAGNLLGEVQRPGSGPLRLLKAGRGNEVLARGSQSLLPDSWAHRVEVLEMLRFDGASLRLIAVERITVPFAVDDPAHGGKDAPARLHSYFPLDGADFTEAGDIVLTELTGSGANFHLCRRLSGEEPWENKFQDVKDLNAEELELARTEWRDRAGTEEDPEQLRGFFDGLGWRSENRRPASEPIETAMKRLDPTRAGRL